MSTLPDAQRVVITGVGAVSGYGNGAAALWSGIKSGRSAIRLQDWLHADLPTRIGSAVIDKIILPDFLKSTPIQTKSTQMALATAWEAWLGAQLPANPRLVQGLRIHASIGWGSTDPETLYAEYLHSTAPSKVAAEAKHYNYGEKILNTFFQPSHGIRSCLSACAASTQAIGRAYHDLKLGRCDYCLAGGADTRLHPLGMIGYQKLGALASGYETRAEQACRPFDQSRNGFVIGEGGGFLLMETLAQARKRGVEPLAELLGVATNTDAFRLTDPEPSGRTASICILQGMKAAGICAEQIDYIQAHGTGTQANDRAEAAALHLALGAQTEQIKISSLKPYVGHLSMAAGAVETVACVSMLREGYLPECLNLSQPEEALNLNYVQPGQQRKIVRTILKTSFGFGGQNACILLACADG